MGRKRPIGEHLGKGIRHIRLLGQDYGIPQQVDEGVNSSGGGGCHGEPPNSSRDRLHFSNAVHAPERSTVQQAIHHQLGVLAMCLG